MKLLVFLGLSAAAFPFLRGKTDESTMITSAQGSPSASEGPHLGLTENGFSHVFLAKNNTPAVNMRKIFQMMGGIEKYIGPTDIIVLKPNAQWWNQGTTNTDAIQEFIDMVLAIPGFSGEVIIAENHQYDDDDSRGWSTGKRNGKYNLNELVKYYQDSGHNNVTKYHWHVAGKTSLPLKGNAQGDRRVNGPEDGDGYAWLEDACYISPTGRKCLMTYPVFTSSYSGITIDLKNGPWKEGRWLDNRKLKFINFSALNHHGWYCGVTASIKNLMGVVDMSCGFPGDLPENTYNTHHIGVSKLKEFSRKPFLWRISGIDAFRRYIYRNFHHTGGALGCFMKNVRAPDLNIITAEWVGWGSRTNPQKSLKPKALLAGLDPVALDYIAAKEIVCPGTPPGEFSSSGEKYLELNDPDIKDGPFRKFLEETNRQGVGMLDTSKIIVVAS